MHSAFGHITGLFSHVLNRGAPVLSRLLVWTCLFYPLAGLSQEAGTERPDNNLSEANLEEDAEPVRRIQRLGDVVGENEWEIELTVPQAEGSLPQSLRLPDNDQQEQLANLLSELASNPGDEVTLRKLNLLMNNVISQTNAAIDDNQQERAAVLLGVVQAVMPKHPGIDPARNRLKALGEVQGQLEAAREAMAAGRVDLPETNSAWYFYRQVLDQYPDNEEAQAGLLAVQQDMVARANVLAARLDFDSAERLLEDASFVRQDQSLIVQARAAIKQSKDERAAELESRAVVAMDAGNFQTAEEFLIDLIALGGQNDIVNQLRRRLEEARVYGGFKPGQEIRDHFLRSATWAPESVVVMAGSFQMGSPPMEQGRSDNEGPQHRVTFRRGFAIGLREVSVAEFRIFVSKTGYRSDARREGESTIYDHYSGRLTEKKGITWETDYEGNPAKENDPVVHVSWNDAQAYVKWLANGTGKSYRLPTEAEFEYALRGGTNTPYWWGAASPPRVVENLTGEGDSSRARRRWSVSFPGYSDKFWGPAPVASFPTNPYGLHDIGGNVGEWVRDCWHDTYIRAPIDGSAWINPGCEEHVIRGGYWASSPDQTRSAYRLFAKPNHHDARIGFRIARDL
ncbi:MAG TPA: SUMF1/EgtB/PvdO family nonheme iron enzyme [Xanthomonadales bacterium]|nr:SUMF1/EgtB/PvdO family nonheme iron enzyme [Xanthomonadales bacterium]